MESGMIWALFGFLWVFGWVIVGLVGNHLKSKRRNERLRIVHEERMKAMEKGIPLPEFPELAEEENGSSYWGESCSSPPNPRGILGGAAVVATIGVGLSVVFVVWGSVSETDGVFNLWPLGLLPVFVGLGLVFYHYLTRTDDA